MPHRVIAIVTDDLHGPEPLEQIQANSNGTGVEVRATPSCKRQPTRRILGVT